MLVRTRRDKRGLSGIVSQEKTIGGRGLGPSLD